MAETEKLTLIAKIAAACDAVGGIEKKGKNEKQNYKYLKAADVAKAIRHEFFERKVIIVFDEKEFTQIRTIKTNSGGEMGEFLLRAEVTFYDGESSEKIGPFGAFGVAMDTGDKAIWKAKTGALKYVLRGIGLIPDEKDDPEADSKVDEETSQAEGRFMEKTGQAKAPPALVKAFWSIFEKSGKTKDQLQAILRARWSADEPDQLSKEEIGDLVRWVSSQEPLAQTLETSVKVAQGGTERQLDTSVAQDATKAAGTPKGAITEKQVGRLWAIAKAHSVPERDVRQYVSESYGLEHVGQLTRQQYDHVVAWTESEK